MPPKKIFFTIEELVPEWKTYPWSLKALLIEKSEIKQGEKKKFMELFFSDPTGKIRAVAFDGRTTPIEAYDQHLQVKRIYTIRNARVKPWVMGPFVHLCEIVLPDISEIEMQPVNSFFAQKKKKTVSWSDEEEVESFYHQDKKPKLQLSEDEPSTARVTEQKKNENKEVLFIETINPEKWGFAVCSEDDCRQKMVALKKSNAMKCPECKYTTEEYGWNTILEVTVTDGQEKKLMTFTSTAAEKLLGVSSQSIAEYQAANDKKSLSDLVDGVKGKVIRALIPTKKGEVVPMKIIDLEENITQDEIYNMLKKAIEKRNELLGENERLLQNIRDLDESETHRRNMQEQDILRNEQTKNDKRENKSG